MDLAAKAIKTDQEEAVAEPFLHEIYLVNLGSLPPPSSSYSSIHVLIRAQLRTTTRQGCHREVDLSEMEPPVEPNGARIARQNQDPLLLTNQAVPLPPHSVRERISHFLRKIPEALSSSSSGESEIQSVLRKEEEWGETGRHF